jgi:hypothetical protein
MKSAGVISTFRLFPPACKQYHNSFSAKAYPPLLPLPEIYAVQHLSVHSRRRMTTQALLGKNKFLQHALYQQMMAMREDIKAVEKIRMTADRQSRTPYRTPPPGGVASFSK